MTIHAAMNAAQPCTGLDHGLAIGTQVMTLEGAFPVEYLCPGDRIITRTGAQKLVAIEMNLVQNARVVRISVGRISQGVLGAGRPSCEITVTPDQPILIRDWRAKALTGAATALIPAIRLVDGAYIRTEVIPELRLFTLRFDEEVGIYAGDLELACTSAPIAA